LIDQRRKLVESEVKQLIQTGHMLTAEQALYLLNQIGNLIKNVVRVILGVGVKSKYNLIKTHLLLRFIIKI
tara:strand:+ start:14186 stop:14398 length:213 start_codon:yes stop_codon:yes gene_type:complete